MGQPVQTNKKRWEAILLVGPTGSGKTPLGQLLEKEGLGGKQCLHFDFGESLRSSVKEDSSYLTSVERRIVDNSLRTGALLENEHFFIAKKILSNYLSVRNCGADTLVVLNGLPRHTGQAEAMKSVVDMQSVVSLDCEPETVWERVRTNAGGDREGRSDDTLEAVKQRIETYKKRTVLLLNHYRGLGVPVLLLDVGIDTKAQDMRLQLESKWTDR